MSFADELRGISRANEGKPTIHDQMVAEAEQNFPRFVELIYTYLKGQCLIYANSGQTRMIGMSLSSFIEHASDTDPQHTFSSIFVPEEGRSRPYTPEEQELVREIRWYLGDLCRDRYDEHHYCLQERYAASLVSEISARFQAEGLQVESSMPSYRQGYCDVEFKVSW